LNALQRVLPFGRSQHARSTITAGRRDVAGHTFWSMRTNVWRAPHFGSDDAAAGVAATTPHTASPAAIAQTLRALPIMNTSRFPRASVCQDGELRGQCGM
jgi:hypothetical protein